MIFVRAFGDRRSVAFRGFRPYPPPRLAGVLYAFHPGRHFVVCGFDRRDRRLIQRRATAQCRPQSGNFPLQAGIVLARGLQCAFYNRPLHSFALEAGIEILDPLFDVGADDLYVRLQMAIALGQCRNLFLETRERGLAHLERLGQCIVSLG